MMESNDLYEELLVRYYSYCYFEAMHYKYTNESGSNPYRTVIIGSSYGLDDIEPGLLEQKAINLAGHSQDFFYDMMHLYHILSADRGQLTDCLWIQGYYSFFYDLSRGKEIQHVCLETYGPLFGNMHHAIDLQDRLPEVTSEVKDSGFREWCHEFFTCFPSYYGSWYRREQKNPFFGTGRQFSGNWESATEEVREEIARYRAEKHNKHYYYKDTFEENKEIFDKTMNLLSAMGIRVHIVIPPFVKGYLERINPLYKKISYEIFEEKPYEINVIDFNEEDLFETKDFADPDHLNLRGAEKFTGFLNDIIASE